MRQAVLGIAPIALAFLALIVMSIHDALASGVNIEMTFSRDAFDLSKKHTCLFRVKILDALPKELMLWTKIEIHGAHFRADWLRVANMET